MRIAWLLSTLLEALHMTTKPRRTKCARKAASRDFAEWALYDGTRLLGSFSPVKAGFAAYDCKGRRLGAFDDADAARLAILEIAKP